MRKDFFQNHLKTRVLNPHPTNGVIDDGHPPSSGNSMQMGLSIDFLQIFVGGKPKFRSWKKYVNITICISKLAASNWSHVT